jgi:diguanylate cyclase (GGDEF)-like protein/PAS domain S-box-containing protein
MSAETVPGTAGAEFADFDAKSLHTIADHLDEVLWLRQPTGRLSFVSRQSVAVLGAAPPQLLEDPDLWPRLVPAEWHHRLVWRQPLQRLERSTSSEYPVRVRDGERWVQESCFPVRDGSGRLLQLIGATRDVTGRRRAEQALRQRLEQAHDLAERDPLTGLLNRRGLEHAARELSRGGGQDTAVLLIDCDDFKRINDVHGHDAGDEVLVQIATRTRNQLRPTDCLGRLGGDEFLAVLPQTRLGEAMRIAQRITAAVGQTPIVCRGQTLSATISIGAGSLPPGCVSIGAALASADASLLAGKRCGKNRVVAQADANAPAAVPAPQAPAITSVRTLAQPLCRLDDLTVVAHELLSRGPHGCESPTLLFALAAANDTAACVDWLCLESAVAAAAAVGDGRLPAHANVLPATLLETPVDRLAALAARVAGGLVLEIPEQHLVGAPLRMRERMRALRDLGVKVALDGLGYGRGSLEALLLLEPDIVKVDRRLVQGADRDGGRSRTLARLLGIANGLGTAIVAVGIETAAERAMLLDLGYTLGQGFLLGRPTPVRAHCRATNGSATPARS